MRSLDYSIDAADEARETLSGMDPDEPEAAVKRIMSSDAVFVAGAGRSLLMLKAFAMRLMHFGVCAHVVGETATPAITERDLLIAASGSGETETILVMARKAVSAGAFVVAVTANKSSSIASIARELIIIPAGSKAGGAFSSRQPSGNSFEQSLLLVLDGMALSIAGAHGICLSENLRLHANLE